jgi:hypothetical protein
MPTKTPSHLRSVQVAVIVEQVKYLLFAQPLLFSKRVKASFVDTLLSPEQTSRATIAAIVVPTIITLGSVAFGRD